VRGTVRGQCAGDRFQNAFGVLQDIIIPESKHTVVVIDQPPSTDGVTRVRGMLAAVNLNDEAMFATYEIDNEWADGLLAYKFVSIDLTSA